MQKPKYVCDKCHKVYVREKAYMSHECKQMKRELELKSPQGQTAWNYYQLWMRQKNRIPPSASAFLTSNYYRTFINFVQFSIKVKLPMPEKFIWFMVKRDFPPTMWINDEVYVQYINFIDNDVDPIVQVTLSMNTILKYADNQHIDVSDIFTVMPANELLYLIRVRQISPWLLLLSKKFKQMVSDLSHEQQAILETLIRPEYWGDKLLDTPTQIRDKIKECVAALEI